MEEEQAPLAQAQVEAFGRAFFDAARTGNVGAFRKLLPTREEQRMCSEERQAGYGYDPRDPQAKAAALAKSDHCWTQYMDFMPQNFRAFVQEAPAEGIVWAKAQYLGAVAEGLARTPNVYVYLRAGSKVFKIKLDDAIITARGLTMGDGIQWIRESSWPPED
ncbi:MAG TPA: hypothetical protein VFZ61_29190 [Polyangiales bacterium]